MNAESLLHVQSVNGSKIGVRLQSLIRYGACLGLRVSVVEPGAKSHQRDADARSDRRTASTPSATPGRASGPGNRPTDEICETPPDPDPEWIEAELREQSRREY